MLSNQPTLPDGLRIYAIGDIHGCLGYLQQLLQKIEGDCVNYNGIIQTVFLGDYIDRGLYSKQTIDFMLDWRIKQKACPIFLLGNHEQVMLKILREHDPQLLHNWFNFGGRETLMSYGVNPSLMGRTPENIFADMLSRIPPTHIDFLDKLELSVSFGDYFFCHAGVRPNVALARQTEQDLTWIRYEFLNHSGQLEKVIVHGHTISQHAEILSNRIGIDTGAYATGCLTALALEDTKRWFLQTAEAA